MKHISATVRIALSLACLSVSLLLAAYCLGLFPDERPVALRGRSNLCESIAINSSVLAERGQPKAIAISLKAIANRNEDILSIGIRRPNGKLLFALGDHASQWRDAQHSSSTETHMSVPIANAGGLWGHVEVCFRPLRPPGFMGFLRHPIVLLALFIAVSSALLYYVFLRRVLQHLNPSKVVPTRVRSALDTLAEGLLLLDTSERIVLANDAFSKTVGRGTDQLVGRRPCELPWKRGWQDGQNEASEGSCAYVWSQVLQDGQPRTGILMGLEVEGENDRTFLVNATPVIDEEGKNRGVLASFEDVTLLEKKKTELSESLATLKQSSEQIRRQNEELELLATTDPLTSCLNRRAFFEKFETLWHNATRYNHPLSFVMVDVDHFKLINDQFGHSVGDQVLQQVSAVLRTTARSSDVVCRYGGEEFAILLPHVGIDEAEQAAERFRVAIETLKHPKLTVAASLGVSALSLGSSDPQGLLEQADTCLFAAKRSGRNRVVRWDEIPDDFEIDESNLSPGLSAAEVDEGVSIPFQAVTALISALAYRDRKTAEHSRRVADLCVAVAESIMSPRNCYVLEIAALLHDIGKIGVPDAILLKPERLSQDEWKVMEQHDRIGVEIIRASFRSKQLSAIVENYRKDFASSPQSLASPSQSVLSVGARILAIADAYDAMVTDLVYRKGRSRDEAFAELRSCAGMQFDPELVEQFINHVTHRNVSESLVPVVSKEFALDIGLQIERLMVALEDQDRIGLRALAERLKSTAMRYGVDEIADKAGDLHRTLDLDASLMEVLQAASELMDLCRATQKSYLQESYLQETTSSSEKAEHRLEFDPELQLVEIQAGSAPPS